ncbi:MAG: hypothetical protein V1905_00960 [bacterium]
MSVIYPLKRGNWFQGHFGSAKRAWFFGQLNWPEKSEQPNVSEFCALGETNDPETRLLNVFLIEKRRQ